MSRPSSICSFCGNLHTEQSDTTKYGNNGTMGSVYASNCDKLVAHHIATILPKSEVRETRHLKHNSNVVLTQNTAPLQLNGQKFDPNSVNQYRTSLRNIEFSSTSRDKEEDQQLSTLRDITVGLRHLHESGHFPATLSPDTIFIDDDTKQAVVTDFGGSGGTVDEQQNLESLYGAYTFILTKGQIEGGTLPASNKLICREPALAQNLLEFVKNLKCQPTPKSEKLATSKILEHPFFWGALEKINFLITAFGLLKNRKHERFNEYGKNVFDGDWIKALKIGYKVKTEKTDILNFEGKRKNSLDLYEIQNCTKEEVFYVYEINGKNIVQITHPDMPLSSKVWEEYKNENIMAAWHPPKGDRSWTDRAKSKGIKNVRGFFTSVTPDWIVTSENQENAEEKTFYVYRCEKNGKDIVPITEPVMPLTSIDWEAYKKEKRMAACSFPEGNRIWIDRAKNRGLNNVHGFFTSVTPDWVVTSKTLDGTNKNTFYVYRCGKSGKNFVQITDPVMPLTGKAWEAYKKKNKMIAFSVPDGDQSWTDSAESEGLDNVHGFFTSDTPNWVVTASKRDVYKKDSLYDLLRFIRNSASHFWENKQGYQKCFQGYPNGFWNFFASRYPSLLTFVYEHARKELKINVPNHARSI